jgi:pimeloyl-ACP methyl ester carboxylesterase
MVAVGLNEGGDEMTMPTALFIHGFLDDATVWDGVIESLAGKVDTARYTLPGFGTRARSVALPQDLSLELLAAEAGEIVAGIDNAVIVVGQSMGTQVAELVAAQHADRVAGLVLLTPVPLGGTQLADEALTPFRALGGDFAAQRIARATLSPGLDEQQLDRLTKVGASARPDVVARYAEVWNDGVEDAPAVSDYTGPVLVIRGGVDAFVTEQLVDTITPRFPRARTEIIDRAGHWVHAEYPQEVAAMIVEFSDSIGDERGAAGWRNSFAEKSRAAFADEFADDIVLEATTLAKRVEGKDHVATVLGTASGIYESLEFTAEAHCGATSYLQWRATAFGGMEIKGITVLERDARGKIVKAAIHHRPLTAALRFAAEIRDRLDGVIAADNFLEETP